MPHPLVSRRLPLHIPLRLGFIQLQNLRFLGESDGRAGLIGYAVRFPCPLPIRRPQDAPSAAPAAAPQAAGGTLLP